LLAETRHVYDLPFVSDATVIGDFAPVAARVLPPLDELHVSR